MHILALLAFLVALVLFVIDGVAKVTRPLIPWGLAFLTLGLLLHFLIEAADPITWQIG